MCVSADVALVLVQLLIAVLCGALLFALWRSRR